MNTQVTNPNNLLTEVRYNSFVEFLIAHGWEFKRSTNWEHARYYHSAWSHPIIINKQAILYCGDGNTFKLWVTLFKNYESENSRYIEHLQRNL